MNAAAAAFAINLPRLPAAIPRSGVSREARMALRQLLDDNDRQLAEAFRAGANVDDLTHARADAVERIVAHAWTACIGDADAAALHAVGGFGRAELFPHSDVDLLVLCDQSPTGPLSRALEAFFACLWDIGLKPGHAVRTLAECREHAAADAAKDDGGEAVVLLSPACASFDQFRNFEMRGEAFRQAAQSIKGVQPIGGKR